MVSVEVDGTARWFMVDTGATYSTCTAPLPTPTSKYPRTVSVVGMAGVPMDVPFSDKVTVTLAQQTFKHSFLLMKQCPVNLLGRDIMTRLNATIVCGPDNITVRFPDGSEIKTKDKRNRGMYPVVAEPPPPKADIYWGRVTTEELSPLSVAHQWALWKPWILSLHPYLRPPDPIHCTLNYDRGGDLVYLEQFADDLAGKKGEVWANWIYVGKEGVAAKAALPPNIEKWFNMPLSVPHVSLALSASHTAKELGPMTKALETLGDWEQTELKDVHYSPSSHSYRIKIETHDAVEWEHVELTRNHGGEMDDGEGAEEMLAGIPPDIWASSATDVGRMNADPVGFEMKPGPPVRQSQYPIKASLEEGLAEVVKGLEKTGVIHKTHSKWNSPIMAVLKPGTGKTRMVHDLRRINDRVKTSPTPVPNPYNALGNLSSKHTVFSVIDLSNAFFCIPLKEELAEVFAFTFRGQQYTYSALPQGFVLSPGVFNQLLRDKLKEIQFGPGVVLVQYVDDLLIAADSVLSCNQATGQVLRKLHVHGMKASRSKIQCSRACVSFLGKMVSGQGVSMSPKHREDILNHPKPKTVSDMLSFLGLCGYSRNCVEDYTGKTSGLRELVKQAGVRQLKAQLDWTKETEDIFISLKQELSTAVELALPKYELPFHLDVSTKTSTASAVLYQMQGGGRKILLYSSVLLEPIVQRGAPCERFAAATAKLIEKTAHVVLHHSLMIHTSHAVAALVNSSAFSFSNNRKLKVEAILSQPHLTFAPTQVNMADGIMEGEMHDCVAKVREDRQCRPGLRTEPLEKGKELFVDGCCFRDEYGELQTGWAVVQGERGSELFTTVAEGKVKGKPSAQRAEVTAVLEALRYASKDPVTIYSDSAYVVGSVF